MKSFIITGTDTDVGKTLLASLLMASLPEYFYWKPVQSGSQEESDSMRILRVAECTPDRILRERFVLSQPFSPHLAARLDGRSISADELDLPPIRPLMLEGAGGLLVPLNEQVTFIEMFKQWSLPVVLACRSTLGTINHTLLSLEALRRRDIPVLGFVMIGEENRENEYAIIEHGGADLVGRIPLRQDLKRQDLQKIFSEQFGSFSQRIFS